MTHPVPPPGSSRRQALADLTRRLEGNGGFSFLRLGDGELDFLIKVQSGQSYQVPAEPLLGERCVEHARGSQGLGPEHAARLQSSYETCDYLDQYLNQASNQRLIPRWQHQRAAAGYSTPTAELSALLPDWILWEFKSYIARHRCLFLAAEAPLQAALLKDNRYLQGEAARFWPTGVQAEFVSPPAQGRDLSANLETMKQQLQEKVRTTGCDVLFLSVGGAAKILGAELARECRVTTIDFGSMLRALTYSGSSGAATRRAEHNIFLLRVPFDVYMDAVEASSPGATIAYLIAKAVCQLCLELQRKVLAVSLPCELHDPREYDPSPGNMQHFWQACGEFDRRYRRRAMADTQARAIVKEFDLWRRKKGLGMSGQIFRSLVQVKSVFRKLGIVRS